jgi:dTDP-4-amino-4,6-dideoxygalactose transaminase
MPLFRGRSTGYPAPTALRRWDRSQGARNRVGRRGHTTPWTFIATSTAVVLADAIPVFVDIELDTLNMNLDQVEAASRRNESYIAVHFFGRPLDMDRLMAIAKKHNLAVIEDAAHAWGGRYKDRGLGESARRGHSAFSSRRT